MIVTSHIQENAFGYLVNYKLYQPIIPSKNYLICLHGQKEVGPVDGSLLDKVEVHGFPKHAKNGFEFPFNIIAPQVVVGYHYLIKFLPCYIKLKYKPDVLNVTGLSMGGFGTFAMRRLDYFNLIYAIAVVCGGESIIHASSYPETKGWVAHGDKDTIVKYDRSKNFVLKYNETHNQQMSYTLYPNVGHDAWNKAYSVTPGENELLQWFIMQFNEAPKNGQIELIQHLNEYKMKTINFINQLTL